MQPPANYLSIGDTARRCGVSTATLRFYEEKSLIDAERGPGGQRRFHRAMLRRISLIRVAQTLGFSLGEIGEALETLPRQGTPTRKDWQKLSRRWRKTLQSRIEAMEKLRDQLDGCIGCGCLSMKNCALYNPADQAAAEGPGPRYLLRR
jgi:MerR family redox-sensitive transcriptional activator SoxR